MLDLTTPIVPYKGTGIFQLNVDYNEVKNLLAINDIPYKEEIWNKTDLNNLWNVLVITKEGSPEQYSAIELFFARQRLFKICLCEDFAGTLPNGIHTGMSIKEAMTIAPQLYQDEEWDEVYISPDGYFVEYNNRNLDVTIITVFVPELASDNL